MLKSGHTRLPGRVWVLASLALILLATLPPQPPWPGGGSGFLHPFRPGPGGWTDLLQNLALYLPLGLVLSARGNRPWIVCLIAAGVSLATELLQGFVPGRDPAAVDIVANTFGALAGAVGSSASGLRLPNALCWCERRVARALHPEAPATALLSLAWACTAAVIVGLTAWLLSPSPPPPFFYLVGAPLIDRISGPVRIGGNGSERESFRGLVDEVRFYSRARHGEAIRSDMVSAVRSEASSDADLVAAYGFDEGGGTVLVDQSGHGHDGAVRGASWSERGRFKGALSFDGTTSNEVVVPAAAELDFRGAMTLEAWVFPLGPSRGQTAVASHAGDAYYLLASLNGRGRVPAAGGRFAAAPEFSPAADPIPENQWTHLAMTYDGRVIRLYVNGALASSKVRWSSHQPVRASLNGRELSFGLVGDPRRMRSALLEDMRLAVSVRCGELETTPAAAPLFLVGGVGGTEAFALAAAGNELHVRSATWARRLGLASPVYRVPGALDGCRPGSRRDFVLTGRPQAPRVARDNMELQGAAPGLGSGWAFLIHSELLPAWLETVLGLCWLGGLMFPFGYWARVASASALGAAVLAAACYAAPAMARINPIDGVQLVALGGGVSLGVACRMAWRIRGDVRPFANRFTPAPSRASTR